MKQMYMVALMSLALLSTAKAASNDVAGSSTLGVSVSVLQELVHGWSVKKQALGRAVYNEKNQKIGQIADVIVAPDKSLSYAIVATGGFLGMAKHDVAVPADQLKREQNGKIVLNGATKDTLKAMPEFRYAE